MTKGRELDGGTKKGERIPRKNKVGKNRRKAEGRNAKTSGNSKNANHEDRDTKTKKNPET